MQKHYSKKSFPILFIYIFVAFTISIIIAGFILYKSQVKELEDQSRRYLAFSSSIKTSQITSWLNERKNDIDILSNNPVLYDRIQNYIDGAASKKKQNSIREFFSSLYQSTQYESIILANKSGNIIYSTPDSVEQLSPESKGYFKEALKSGDVVFSGFFKNSIENKVYINFYLPVKSSKVGLPIAILIIRIDPYNRFFPLLKSDLDPSSDIDFYLLRKNGDGYLYLNQLEEINAPPLTIGIPYKEMTKQIKDPGDGTEKAIYLTDYRNEQILANIKKIPGTPWILLSKIDSTKIFEPLSRNTINILSFILLLLLTGGLTIGYIWTKNNEKQYKHFFDTERKKNELSKQYTNLLRLANDIIIIMNNEGKVIEVNEKALSAYGYEKDEILKLSFFDLVSPDLKVFLQGKIEKILSEKGVIYESLHRRKEGIEFPVEISANLIRTNGDSLIQAIIRNISERKRIEKELLDAKEKAELSDKLKTEFLAQMSHEIRSPLNVILGSTNLIYDELKAKISKEKSILFNSIELSSKRILRTINSILNMAELQIGSYKMIMEKIDIIEQVISVLILEYKVIAAEKNIKLDVESLTDKTTVTIDIYSAFQILSNLIDNAIKYTLTGSVTIKVYRNNKNKLVIEIIDTGIGISKEFLPHVFDVFRQEIQGYSRSFEGNGLGLSLTKRYCEMNDVEIEVESEKNKGSLFRLIFNKS